MVLSDGWGPQQRFFLDKPSLRLSIAAATISNRFFRHPHSEQAGTVSRRKASRATQRFAGGGSEGFIPATFPKKRNLSCRHRHEA